MFIIEHTIRLEGPLGEREVTALFDNGASVSCIRPELAKELEQPIPLRTPLAISTADVNNNMSVDEKVSIEFYLN